MKKRFILFFVAIGLIMAFAPTQPPLDLRLIPVAPSISDSVWLLGHKKATGIYTTYRFSMPQLASYLGAGTGLGNNFANADLDVTASRFHTFHKYGMVWDSVYYFNYVDSFGDSIISINNFFSPHNCMIRVGSYGNTGSVTINTKDQRGHLGVGSTALTLGCGASAGFMTSIAGISFIRFGLSGNVNFLIDSPTHTVYLGDWSGFKGLQIDYTSGATKVNNAYILPTVDASAVDEYMTSNAGGLASWSLISHLSLITKYNGSSVAGNGVPAIRSSNFHANATTAAPGFVSITAAANVYEVGGYININSVTTDVLALRLTWTDPGSVIHTHDFIPNGGTLSTLSNVQHYLFSKVEIYPKTGTTISLGAVLTTGGGTIDYDYCGHIVQMN